MENTILESHLNHNHEKDEHNIMVRQVIRNSVKRKAQDDVCERPLKLIYNELKTTNTDTLNKTDMNCFRKSIYLARRSQLPTRPANIQNVHEVLDSLEIKTYDNEPFLMVNDHKLNIIMFSCEKNLNTLCSLKTMYVDGTFKYCTKFFVQLFTIHGLSNGHYIPLVFFLLNNKECETYATCFNILKNRMF